MTPAIVQKTRDTLLKDLAGTFAATDLQVLSAEELGELAAHLRNASWHVLAAADLAELRGRPGLGE